VTGLLTEILRCAQDDISEGCHPERSEGSLWGKLILLPDARQSVYFQGIEGQCSTSFDW